MRSSASIAIIIWVVFVNVVIVLSDRSMKRLHTADGVEAAKSYIPQSLFDSVNKSNLCLPVDQNYIQGVSLTPEETDLLSNLCWRVEMGVHPAELQSDSDRGVPQGVKCNVTSW